MQMQLHRVCAVLALLLASSGALAKGWHVYLPGGQMRFQGQVIADACEVEAGDRALTVNMGQVSSNAFRRTGDDADPVPFRIRLLNCNTNISQHVAIQFRGVGDGKNPDVLSVGEGPGVATNVGVALFDRNGVLIPVNSPLLSGRQMLQAGPVTLDLVAKYRATGRDVTGGRADAQAWFYLTYE